MSQSGQLKQPQIYYGPDECIDDHVESKYFDNPTVCQLYYCISSIIMIILLLFMQVRTAIHVQSKDVIGGWRMCTRKIQYRSNTASLLPIYPTLM